MSSEIPTVSAIMPTRGRPEWAADAVRMFLAQTWPKRELVIIDDKTVPSFPRGITAEGVRYYAEPCFNVGAKRNLAVSRATGEIIMHWDSDDIYTAGRMEHQANLLIRKGVDLVGYHEMEFIDVDGPRYSYRASAGYAIGVSQTYWRDVWLERAFEAIDSGEDNAFLNGRTVFCCPAEGRIVARIHGDNTSDKRKMVRANPQQWRRIA